MLEYSKLILEKVSFDPKLFAKELRKAVKYLVDNEVRELRAWCNNRFGEAYMRLVRRFAPLEAA